MLNQALSLLHPHFQVIIADETGEEIAEVLEPVIDGVEDDALADYLYEAWDTEILPAILAN